MATGKDIRFGVKVDTGDSKKKLDELGQELEQLDKEAQGLGKTGKTTSTVIDGMGRSADDAADKVDQLGKELDQAATSTQTAARGAQRFSDSAQQTAAATDRIRGSAGAAGDLLHKLAGQLAAAFTVRELVTAAAQMESIERGLAAVAGNSEDAAQEMEFLRRAAFRVGADITEVGRAYLSLAASTKGTAVEGQATREVFEAVSLAMSRAGRTSAETQNALTALSQIASKGTVSMEELRGQLGEALPGALQAAANGMGITTKDLVKLVEEGRVAAEDLFPALTKGLNELYGKGAAGSQTLAQEITNIKNQFVELASNIGKAGGLDALKTGAEVAQSAIVLLDDTLVTIGKTIGVVAAAVSNLDFSGLPEAFAEIETESREKLLKAAEHNETLRNALELSSNEAIKAALKQRDAARAAAEAGDATEAQGVTLIGLRSAYSEVVKSIELEIEAASRLTKLRAAEAKTALVLAEAKGTELEKRQAIAAASLREAEALAIEGERRTTLVNVLQAERDALIALIERGGKPASDNQKEQLRNLDQLIKQRSDEAAQIRASADAMEAKAQQDRLAAELARDNSERIDELRQSMEAANAEVALSASLLEDGIVTQEEHGRVVRFAAEATRIYADAFADLAAKIASKNRLVQAELQLDITALRTAREAAQASYAVAKATGDEEAATQALIQAKVIEIRIAQLQAQAKRAEADAAMKTIEAKRAELIATGQLTEAKRAELAAQEAAAKAKRLEAEAADITAVKLIELANATLQAKDAATESAKAYDTFSQSLGGANDQLERNIDLRGRQAGLPTSATGTTSGADGGGSPFTRTAVGQNLTSIIGMLKGWGVGDAQAEQIARRFVDPSTGEIPAFGASEGQRAFSRSPFDTWSVALRRAAEEALYGGSGLAGSGTSAGGTPGALRTVNVNLSLGGRTTTVATASDADAQALEGFLRTLETDLRRASA